MRESWWRRRESNPRPRVRPRGTLHACPLLISHARREETAKNRRAPGPVSLTIRRRATRLIASLFNGIWPPTTRRGQGRRSLLIKQRERTEYPQLTDVPSDLRVDGARHASRESLPPSKPYRPQREEHRSNVSSRDRIFILRARVMSVNYMYRLGLLGWQGLTRRGRPLII